jgi:Mrp family chromosome partitioning ATPase
MQDCPAGTNEAGVASGCAGCDGQAVCSSSREKDVDEKLQLRMQAVRHKILVLSGKGGVGKSTIAVQLACELARSGRRVGLLDLDLCGPSLAQMLGLNGAQVVNSQAGWMPVKPDGFDGRLSVMSISLLLGSLDSAVIWRGPRKHSTILSFLRDVYWSKVGTKTQSLYLNFLKSWTF